jgi:hypothetical protein
MDDLYEDRTTDDVAKRNAARLRTNPPIVRDAAS